MMMPKEDIFERAARLVEQSTADETEVYFHRDASNLTRFANNHIHQNVSVDNCEILFRVAFGKKVGVAGCNSLENAETTLEQACELAKLSEESPGYPGLGEPAEVQTIDALDQATADCSPAERADRVGKIISEAKTAGAVAAGALSTSVGQSAVVSSKGVQVHHAGTSARLSIVMMKDGGSATAKQAGIAISDINEQATAKSVAEKALQSCDPRDVEPGVYPVVLEPLAVSALVRFLAYVGFNGKAYNEKRSFATGKLGFPVTGKCITLWDDGTDPAGIPIPFDYEGVPKRKLPLMTRGVAARVCHDTRTAAIDNSQSTGHALPANTTVGPLPLNLFMAPGESSIDKMVASTEKGLLVSSFHYVNVAEPMKVVLTGMTRFGLFLIRDGKVAHPVKNLRFTQSVLEAFDRATALTKERQLMPGIGGVMLVPGMKCDTFTFTGTTEF